MHVVSQSTSSEQKELLTHEHVPKVILSLRRPFVSCYLEQIQGFSIVLGRITK